MGGQHADTSCKKARQYHEWQPKPVATYGTVPQEW